MLHRPALLRHLIGIIAPLVLLLARPSSLPIAILEALALFMATFMLTHELAHGALGLSRRANDLALALAGLGIVTSGHALRLIHLRHHKSPLAAHDLEGRSAHLPPWHALAIGPWLSIRLVVEGWRSAPRRERRWQVAEHAATAIAAAAVIVSAPRALQIYLATALAMQALAPFWAGHLPHRTPAWLLAIARPLTRLGSLTMATLVLHDEHHRQPRRTIRELRRAFARADDLESAASTAESGRLHVAPKAAAA